MSDYEVHKAANEYVDRSFPKDAKALKPAGLMNDAFCAGVEWARAQWPITPRTAEEAKPSDFGDAIGLMWRDLGKKLDELSIWCGSLEGQANRIQRETAKAIGEEFGEVANKIGTLGEGMAEMLSLSKGTQARFHDQERVLRDVGQKVEAVISLVDDLDELIRSEDGEAEPLTAEGLEAFKEGVDEAYRPAVGMFGIGGDASVVSMQTGKAVDVDPGVMFVKRENAEPRDMGPDEPSEMYEGHEVWRPGKKPTPTLRNVLQAIEDVRALAVDAGIQFDFSVSTRS